MTRANNSNGKRHFVTLNEGLRSALAEDAELRWEFEEERVRLAVVDMISGLMHARSLTQTDLAALSGTTQPMLSRLLKGDDERSPNLNTLVKIADALGRHVRVEFVEQQPPIQVSWEKATSPAGYGRWAGALLFRRGAPSALSSGPGWFTEPGLLDSVEANATRN